MSIENKDYQDALKLVTAYQEQEQKLIIEKYNEQNKKHIAQNQTHPLVVEALININAIIQDKNIKLDIWHDNGNQEVCVKLLFNGSFINYRKDDSIRITSMDATVIKHDIYSFYEKKK